MIVNYGSNSNYLATMEVAGTKGRKEREERVGKEPLANNLITVIMRYDLYGLNLLF